MICTLSALVGRVTQQNCEVVVDQLGDARSPHDSIDGDVLCSEGECLSDRVRESFIAYSNETGRNRLELGDSLTSRTKQIRGATTIVHVPAQHISTNSILSEPSPTERYLLKMQYREIIRVAKDRGAKSIALPFLSLDYGCNLWHSQIAGLQSLLPMLPDIFERVVFVVNTQAHLDSFKQIIGGGSELSMENSKQADSLCETICNVHIKPPRQPSAIPPTAFQLKQIRLQPETGVVRVHKYRPRKNKTSEIMNRLVNSVSPPIQKSDEMIPQCSISVVVGGSHEQNVEAIVTLNTDRNRPECGIDTQILCIEGPSAVIRMGTAFHAYKEITSAHSLQEGAILPTWADKIERAKMLIHVLLPSIKDVENPTELERWNIFQTYCEILRSVGDEEAKSIALPLNSSSPSILTAILQATLSSSPSKFSRLVFYANTQEQANEFTKVLGGLSQLLISDDKSALEWRQVMCDSNYDLPIDPFPSLNGMKKKRRIKKIITLDGDIIDVIEEKKSKSPPIVPSPSPSSSSPSLPAVSSLLPLGPSLGIVLKQAVKTFKPAFYTDHLRGRSANTDMSETGLVAPASSLSSISSDSLFNENQSTGYWREIIIKAENSELADRLVKNKAEKKPKERENGREESSPNENSSSILSSSTPQLISPPRKRGRPRKSDTPSNGSPKVDKKVKMEENLQPTRKSLRTIKVPQKHAEFESI